MKVFRFDDVCINADMTVIQEVTDLLFERFPYCKVIYGVSPLVHKDCGQRVFPKILNAMSDYRNFYKVDKLGIPEMDSRATLAGHGLIHVDHRLLDKSAQEMSILVSCSLVKAKMFIPPFNKWNKLTEEVCRENDIELIKFERGWLSMEHNQNNPYHDLWYLHARDFDVNKVRVWFKDEK
jgi:hypothetical protein